MPKILIVEDDAHINKALRIRLQAAGYETCSASDSYLGFQVASREKPDLMILDLSMPAGDGFSIVERLGGSGLNSIPFVILTASKQPKCRERAKQLGAADFIEKPYTSADLLERVEAALGCPPAQVE